MKKIMFAAITMNLGGVEKALLAMLNSLPKDRFEIHLFLAYHGGFLIGSVPDNVIVHTIDAYDRNRYIFDHPLLGILHCIRHGRIKDAVCYPPAYVKAKLKRSLIGFYEYFLKEYEPVGEEFDMAVSYAGTSEALDYYVTDKIKAGKRCSWIHFDIDKSYIKPRTIETLYHSFDRIFVVSQTAKDVFDRRFPQFSDKTDVFHNIIDADGIRRLSLQEGIYHPADGVMNIVTVGRLSEEKGQDLAIRAAGILKAGGLRFMWHFVGTGPAASKFRELASDLGLDDCVRFAGLQANPYPFMHGADLYVQPSIYEGYCITVAEAKLFGMPIVSTDFTGAMEQLSEVPNALVVGPRAEAIAEGVEKASAFGRCDVRDDCGTSGEMHKFLDLIDVD